MIESGQYEKIKQKWIKKPPACSGTTDDLILSLGQVRTPFAMVAGGIGLAVILMLWEKCYWHFVHKIKPVKKERNQSS